MSTERLYRLRTAQFRRQCASRDFVTLAHQLLGFHSTDYWSPYLSAWARIGDYDAAAVFEAINTGQGLARVSCYRFTAHVLPAEDVALVLRAELDARISDLERFVNERLVPISGG